MIRKTKKALGFIWNRRALSPIFATVLLAAIVISIGSVAFYFSNNLTNNATTDYLKTLSDSKQSIAERISFENVVYDQSTAKLTVYIINSGSGNSIKLNAIFLYDENHNIVGSPYSGAQISPLQPMPGGTPLPSITPNLLDVGSKEAYFNVFNVKTSTGQNLQSGSNYFLQLITQSGSVFTYEFSP